MTKDHYLSFIGDRPTHQNASDEEAEAFIWRFIWSSFASKQSCDSSYMMMALIMVAWHSFSVARFDLAWAVFWATKAQEKGRWWATFKISLIGSMSWLHIFPVTLRFVNLLFYQSISESLWKYAFFNLSAMFW